MDPLLFLDFDGVLHADPVLLRDGQPWLDPEYGTLFQWAPQLAAVLADFPQVHVILSTSWMQGNAVVSRVLKYLQEQSE